MPLFLIDCICVRHSWVDLPLSSRSSEHCALLAAAPGSACSAQYCLTAVAAEVYVGMGPQPSPKSNSLISDPGSMSLVKHSISIHLTQLHPHGVLACACGAQDHEPVPVHPGGGLCVRVGRGCPGVARVAGALERRTALQCGVCTTVQALSHAQEQGLPACSCGWQSAGGVSTWHVCM